MKRRTAGAALSAAAGLPGWVELLESPRMLLGCHPMLEKMALVDLRHTEWLATCHGDGTVPHSSSLIEGVPTYFANVAHGELMSDGTVAGALLKLLATGQTNALTARVAGQGLKEPALHCAGAKACSLRHHPGGNPSPFSRPSLELLSPAPHELPPRHRAFGRHHRPAMEPGLLRRQAAAA